MKPLKNTGNSGFTLLDLLVVVGMIALLFIIELPVWAGGKSQTKIGICAGHVRQLALSCQMYASDNNNRLPVLSGGASWPWDVPAPITVLLLRYGLATNIFYCPGTSPRFTDQQNWSSPAPGSSLWNFSSSYHITGYAFAFSGGSGIVSFTNQNTTMLPEPVTMAGTELVPRASERVLVADATLSEGAMQPAYASPDNNYVSIAGGFMQNGLIYPHVSAHLTGNVPTGGNLGFKDGHVAWRQFEVMTPRTTTTGPFFWW